MLSPGPISPSARKILGTLAEVQVVLIGNLPVDDDEACNVLGSVEIRVDTGHDEADDPLCSDAKDQTPFGTNPVAHEGSDEGSWNVESVDDCRPAKVDP